jgi:GT2 family glycosyltransferase
MIKVYVVVVTYNGLKWIEECLNSIFNSSVSVIPLVIDNNSTDDTVNFIKANFPDLILWEQNDNLGFGKANNIGMSYVLKQNADFVFLLNQDAFLEKNTIENLISVASKHPEYGILSPVQLDYSGKLLENYFFKFMSEDISREFYSDFVLKNEIKEVYDVDFIQAAAWFLPIKTLNTIGGFDPIFYHYGEDNNYCQRIHYHNLKIGVVTNTYIRHDSKKPSDTSFKIFSERHFSIYKKDICSIYANINHPFTATDIFKARKIIYIKLFKSLLKLNITKAKGYYKQLNIYNKVITQIEDSRKRNIQIKANYLDLS